MRPLLLLVPIVFGVSTLSAQLSPAERQAAVTKEANAHLSERLQAEWTERALNGDASAYGGATARQERLFLNQRIAYSQWLTTVADPSLDPGAYWYNIGVRPSSLHSLRPRNAGAKVVKARKANVLTIAAAAGGPARTLPIRAEIRSSDPTSGWSRTGPVTADQSGRYLIEVPALVPGEYELLIQVFDPAHPDTPLAGSQSALVVK